MKLFLIFACFCLVIQNSKESMPENAESLNLSEIFEEKVNNIEAKYNQILLNRFAPKLSLNQAYQAYIKPSKPPKSKSVKGKTTYQRKYYRNKTPHKN
jgi:hypothetical protein